MAGAFSLFSFRVSKIDLIELSVQVVAWSTEFTMCITYTFSLTGQKGLTEFMENLIEKRGNEGSQNMFMKDSIY